MKFTKRDLLALLLPVLLGAASMGLWLWEIYYGIGWKSLAWLTAELASVYVITALVVLSYLLPIALFVPVGNWVTFSLCALGLYTTGLFSFFSAKHIFFQVYSRIPHDHHIILVIELFGLTLLVGAIFFYLKQYFLFTSHRLHILTVFFVFLSVVPASLISVEWFPALGNASYFVDAVKMGYPVFWLNVMLGHTSYAMVKRWI